MIQFIEDHRGDHGGEPICRVLPIAPATFYDHLAKRADPSRLSDRAKRDEELKPEIERVFEENLSVYGVRKVWYQMRREGFDVARCTVARLLPDLFWMRWNRLFINVGQHRTSWFTTQIAGRNICRSSTRNGWPRRRSPHLSEVLETPMTTPWPKRSTGCSKQRSFIGAGHGAALMQWNTATLEWVDWFNNRRLLEPIGNIPPAEAEANFYAALEKSEMAA